MRKILGLLLLTLIVKIASAQTDTLEMGDLNFKLQQSTEHLLSKFKTNADPTSRVLLNKLSKTVDAYIVHTPPNFKGHFFKDALLRDGQYLDSLNAKILLDTSTVSSIINDLSLKLKHFGFPLASGDDGDIGVKVTTVRLIKGALIPVNGYTIFWNYWLDKKNLQSRANFQNPTNPSALGYVSAGYYDFWAQKINSSVKEPSDHQKKRLVIDPSMPANLDILLIVN